jgi:hypothetical protein
MVWKALDFDDEAVEVVELELSAGGRRLRLY